MSTETDTDGLKVPEEHEQQLTGRDATRIARAPCESHGDARPLILGVCRATDGRTRRDAPQVLVVLFRPI